MFSKPVAGERIAAIFTADVEGGDGEILLLPPQRGERQSLARFTGSPNLNEHFSRALLMFTDDSGRAVNQNIEKGSGHKAPEMAPLLAEQWTPVVSNILDSFAPRIACDLLTPGRTDGLLLAALAGKALGNFDMVYDPTAPEQVVVGQLMERNQRVVYDVWTSFHGQAFPQRIGRRASRAVVLADPVPHRGVARRKSPAAGRHPRYFEDRFSATADVRVRSFARRTSHCGADRWCARGIVDQRVYAQSCIARRRKRRFSARHAGFPGGRKYPPNGVRARRRNHHQPRQRSLFCRRTIQLVSPLRLGIRDYDLEFRYPRRLTLVTPGDIVTDTIDGDWRNTERRTSVPIRVAGFNLGNYERISLSAARAHRGCVRKPQSRSSVATTAQTTTFSTGGPYGSTHSSAAGGDHYRSKRAAARSAWRD